MFFELCPFPVLLVQPRVKRNKEIHTKQNRVMVIFLPETMRVG